MIHFPITKKSWFADIEQATGSKLSRMEKKTLALWIEPINDAYEYGRTNDLAGWDRLHSIMAEIIQECAGRERIEAHMAAVLEFLIYAFERGRRVQG